ncbi:MAG: nitroreductase [Pseudomonadota bacterium]
MTDTWLNDLPPSPQLGDLMPTPQLRADTLAFLASRRSSTAAQMTEPGPSTDETAALLRIAARVPDHRRVHPFRFLTFTGDARSAFGRVLKDAFIASNSDAEPAAAEMETGRFLRAPLIIAVISKVNHEHRTPEWEQVLTAGAVAQNLVIAAGAAGYAAQWLTEWYTYDAHVVQAMHLEEGERVVGFVYIGTASEPPKERARMDAADLTQAWEG